MKQWMNGGASLPPLWITPGEPSGVGPELVLRIARQSWPTSLVAVADKSWMQAVAEQLNIDVQIINADDRGGDAHIPGTLPIRHVELAEPPTLGKLNANNARYVLNCLDIAVDQCQLKNACAMVTGPVHKGIINDSGIAFTGHTEYLANRLGVDQVVMLLADKQWRVALVTTHLPLRQVADAVTSQRLEKCLQIVHRDLQHRFGLMNPRIMVLGLNPHAGERGHLGDEEQRMIEPLLESMRVKGMNITGPIPADTAFSERHMANCDVVLAMYHDQGLTPLKARSFGQIANITLGLPIIRTSVDHGTALDLAAASVKDRAYTDSLTFACEQALQMCAVE